MIRGDVSEIIGNIDDCNISKKEREKGVNIDSLVKV